MGVTIKTATQEVEIKGEKIGFDADFFMAVEGLKGSFFEGQTKVVHKVLGAKLIANKQAKEVKATLIEKDSGTRTSKDVK